MPTLVSRSMLRRTVLAAAGILVLSLPTAAAAQTPAVKYQRAQAREKTARSAQTTTPDTLRAIGNAYEAIVRAHPRTGYADNALWQAAGMYALAFEKSGNVRDREQAVRTLSWLKREYPTSALVRQVPARLASLRAPDRSAPSKAASDGTTARPAVTRATAAPTPAPTPPSTPPRSAETPAASVPPVKPAEKTPADVAAAQPAELEAPSVSVPLPAPALAAASDTPSSPSVRKITHSRLPKGDRLTIELSSEAVYATRRSANPDRLTVDLVNADVAAGISERVTTLSGVLFKSVQVSRTINQNTRFVLDVTGNPRYSTFPLYNPFRLVIDVESDEALPDDVPPAPIVATKMAPSRPGRIVTDGPADAAPPAASAATAPGARAPASAPSSANAPAPPSATSRGEFSIARQLGLGVARIVIDPGHGGYDPGAQANGVTESTLVLDVALRLEKLLLEKPGFEVVLTRRTDRFIPLEERTAIAQREAADMFISIHANSSPQSSTRGLETYYLDFASNPQAEAVAARENASSAQTMRLLPELVKAITLNNKLDESRELARQVQAALVKRLAGPNKAIKDFGVKRAPFVVLIGAEMPSVLAEVSFLTNRTDASLLKQAAHRQRIALALFEAVQSYRSSLKKIGTVAAR
ncbi:MAG: N-acetylmuramoyl-L-alanine amidase [Acidobacteria bacterium]|nr:N-acetylmuramoyl-L-alanine amidase [Acidobacteriota bacterium]